jgi:hypothetical protein
MPPAADCLVTAHTAGSRARDGRFLPGRSGNPGGRPGSSEEFRRIRALYREHSEEAVSEAKRLMDESCDDRVKLAACQLIMDRGWGKAPDSYNPEKDPEAQQAQIDWGRTTPEQRDEVRRYLAFLNTLPRLAEGN